MAVYEAAIQRKVTVAAGSVWRLENSVAWNSAS